MFEGKEPFIGSALLTLYCFYDNGNQVIWAPPDVKDVHGDITNEEQILLCPA